MERDNSFTVRERWEGREVKPHEVVYRNAQEAFGHAWSAQREKQSSHSCFQCNLLLYLAGEVAGGGPGQGSPSVGALWETFLLPWGNGEISCLHFVGRL